MNCGRPFARNTVYRLFRNEKYTGVYRYGEEVFENIYPAIICILPNSLDLILLLLVVKRKNRFPHSVVNGEREELIVPLSFAYFNVIALECVKLKRCCGDGIFHSHCGSVTLKGKQHLVVF